MIANIQKCSSCQSDHIVKNGHTRHGNQRSKCHDCGKTRVVFYKKSKFDKSPYIEKLLRERLSLRGIARVFNVSVETVLLLLKQFAQKLPSFRQSVRQITSDDVIEFDWASPMKFGDLWAIKSKNDGFGLLFHVKQDKLLLMLLETTVKTLSKDYLEKYLIHFDIVLPILTLGEPIIYS